jgi:NTE family protein
MIGTKALVLGGGGIAGLGWFAGLLHGLHEAGIDLRDADKMIGTSAGSVTAAQLRSAQSIETLYALQTDPTLIIGEPPPSADQFAALMSAYPGFMAITDTARRMQVMGSFARSAKTVMPGVRLTMIERRLSEHDWPDAALSITAVDLETSALVTFDARSGVSLVEAVAASCAVPGVWPVVEIHGRAYMDGGVYSADNAQLASGAERALILSPLGGVTTAPPGLALADQVSSLENTGVKVLVIEPDVTARAAMGNNPFDPAIRAPTAVAAKAQGKAIAQTVSEFWA